MVRRRCSALGTPQSTYPGAESTGGKEGAEGTEGTKGTEDMKSTEGTKGAKTYRRQGKYGSALVQEGAEETEAMAGVEGTVFLHCSVP